MIHASIKFNQQQIDRLKEALAEDISANVAEAMELISVAAQKTTMDTWGQDWVEYTGRSYKGWEIDVQYKPNKATMTVSNKMPYTGYVHRAGTPKSAVVVETEIKPALQTFVKENLAPEVVKAILSNYKE